ncbi:MAG: hypothetical protein ACRD2R_01465, partial [Terriglobales bacterium]
MALSVQERKRLLALDLPAAAALRRTVQDYMARTGLNAEDLARRCNYSGVTLRRWLAGLYHDISGSDAALRAALSE